MMSPQIKGDETIYHIYVISGLNTEKNRENVFKKDSLSTHAKQPLILIQAYVFNDSMNEAHGHTAKEMETCLFVNI